MTPQDKLATRCSGLAKSLLAHDPKELALAAKLYAKSLELSGSLTKIPITESDLAKLLAKRVYSWLLMRKVDPEQAWNISGMQEAFKS